MWECANGGQLWTTSATAGYGSGNLPPGFCTTGFASLYTVFILCLLGDIVCQVCSESTRGQSQSVLTTIVDLHAPPHLALPDEAGTLCELEIARLKSFIPLIATDELGYSVAFSYLWMLCLIGGHCLSFYLVCASHGYVYGYDLLRPYHDYDLLRFYIFIS